tara:strand:- start:80 stop:262 length:183 start_codon:yes stop_codon:yes gene_type:complete
MNKKPKTQEEANENVIKHIKSLPKDEAKFIIYEGVRVLEENGEPNAMSLAKRIREEFIRN